VNGLLTEECCRMRILRDNGLTIALMAAFLFSIGGMGLSGWNAHNENLVDHGQAAIGFLAYLASGDFISAVFENWESEFLQMAAYVMLTAFLFQRGSAESRDPDEPEGKLPSIPPKLRSWHPFKRFLYSYSLGIAMALLFALCFFAHVSGSLAAANEEALLHGGELDTLGSHLVSARFWFESFQNWQSEFLSTAVLVVLSIFLRFHGSPESKPVDAPDESTGA
jgi:hypothetical protein